MVILVEIFADKDFEYSIDGYYIKPGHLDFDAVVADAKKRFGDSYSGLNITVRDGKYDPKYPLFDTK